MNNNQQNDVVLAGVKAVAAASQTPFKTAFKVTMGIALAQLATLAIFVVGVATVIFTIAAIMTFTRG